MVLTRSLPQVSKIEEREAPAHPGRTWRRRLPDDRRGAQYMFRSCSSGERARWAWWLSQSPFHSGLQCRERRILVSVS